MFQAENISKSFGDKLLFEGLSFSVSQGDKIALIARNGSGKTSILNIISGLDMPDTGSCSYKKDIKIAYLQQEPVFDPALKVSEALLSVDNEVTRLVREYEECIQQGVSGSGADPMRLQKLVEQMDALNAWDFEHRIKQLISKLQPGDLNAKVGQLSGGQIKRLALARMLLDDADFLLMDEPTNHLDLDMIEWMENFLNRKKLTLLVVTHDRYFLDAVCNGILELDKGIIYSHRGNYSYYLKKKKERLEAQQASGDKAINLLRKETEWMHRSPQARTGKSKSRIDAYYDLQDKANIENEGNIDPISIQMARMGKKILELSHVHKQFTGKKIIHDFSYVFKKGERIGIVGPNGVGKSTLLNIITSQIMPDTGTVTRGTTIRFGYFRQEGLQVDESRRVIEVITDIAETIEISPKKVLTASQLLHHFNFDHSLQYDWVGKLSGGEKRRLYLITILMRNPNFLILDEPTNDFDIETLNILEDFLQDFGGCLLIVSHDRYFLDKLVDFVFVFRPEGEIKVITGNYSTYRLATKHHDMKPAKSNLTGKPMNNPPASERNREKLSYKERKEFEALEEEIDTLENKKKLLLLQLSDDHLSPEERLQVAENYKIIEEQLDKSTDRWLELSEKS